MAPGRGGFGRTGAVRARVRAQGHVSRPLELSPVAGAGRQQPPDELVRHLALSGQPVAVPPGLGEGGCDARRSVGTAGVEPPLDGPPAVGAGPQEVAQAPQQRLFGRRGQRADGAQVGEETGASVDQVVVVVGDGLRGVGQVHSEHLLAQLLVQCGEAGQEAGLLGRGLAQDEGESGGSVEQSRVRERALLGGGERGAYEGERAVERLLAFLVAAGGTGGVQVQERQPGVALAEGSTVPEGHVALPGGARGVRVGARGTVEAFSDQVRDGVGARGKSVRQQGLRVHVAGSGSSSRGLGFWIPGLSGYPDGPSVCAGGPL